ncbi:MAG: hypothetical protein ACR2PV_06080 [Gammaproteobacteria bacterium]
MSGNNFGESSYDIAMEPQGKGTSHRLILPNAHYYKRALFALDELFARVLRPAETVTIFTTSQSLYVSSCLTESIKRAGKTWSRVFEENTGMVVVIHEWGFLYPHLAELKRHCRRTGAVLVEDYAYGTGTFFARPMPLRRKHFMVLSLRKFFGDGGGVLLAPDSFIPQTGERLPKGLAVSGRPHHIIAKRRRVWQWYRDETGADCGRWIFGKNESPGAFVLPCERRHTFLRTYLREQGIECGYWFGNQHLFLPCHQDMQKREVKKICVQLREGFNDCPADNQLSTACKNSS